MNNQICIIFDYSKSGIKAARRANAYKIIGVGVAATINNYKNIEKLLEIIK